MFSSKKKTTTPAASASNATATVDVKAVERLFDSLVDPDDPDTMYMDGISKMCESLGLDPATDKLRVGDVDKLKALVPSFDPGFLEKSEFRDFYKFVFQFSREGTNKTIEKEIIISLLPIVLDNNRAPHLSHFLRFLESCAHQRITLDQWDSFLQFNSAVSVDLSNLEEDGAWPLLLDEYVEWRKSTEGDAKKA